MRRFAYAALMALTAALAIHCNSIIGVEDVKLASSSKKDAGTKAGDDDDGDPVDRSSSGDPPAKTTPEPTKPSGTTACKGTVACKRLAFVTRVAFTGNLGGVAGADAKCNDAAKAVTTLAGHEFKAWLSEAANVATSRLTHGSDTYARVDSQVIASTFADLIDGTLTAAISLDEKGAALPPEDATTWTGTTSDGLNDIYTCKDWSSEDILDTGLFGDSQLKTLEWTESATSSCNAQRHLYCVEF